MGSNNNKSLFKSPELPAPLQTMPMLSYTTKSSSLSTVINNNSSSNNSNNNNNNNRSMAQSSFKSSGSYSPVPSNSNTGINWPLSSQDKIPNPNLVSLVGSANNNADSLSCNSMMDARLVTSSTAAEQKTLSTSTPSSPAELSPISIENRSLPLIIPTEAISDQDNNKSTIAKEVDSLKGNDFVEGCSTTSFDQIKASGSSATILNEFMNKYPTSTIIQSGSGNSIKDMTDSSPMSPSPAANKLPSSASNNLSDDNITAAIASSQDSVSSS